MPENIEYQGDGFFLFDRCAAALSPRETNLSFGSRQIEAGLLFLDPGLIAQGARQTCGEQDLCALFSIAFKAVRKGGSVAVLVDMWSLTSVYSALEHAGFKQLRFVQVVSETDVSAFYPDDSRTMAILAVKGGGSTFNDFYNNGHFPRPVEGGREGRVASHVPPIPFLLSEIVSIHTNDGDSVATNSASVASALHGAHITRRTKPPVPAKKAAA